MVPTSAERALLLTPRVEELTSVTAPCKPTALEPEEATQSQEFTLVPIQRPMPTPSFTLSWTDKSRPPPLGDADWPMSTPLGFQLDLTSLDHWSELCPTTQ